MFNLKLIAFNIDESRRDSLPTPDQLLSDPESISEESVRQAGIAMNLPTLRGTIADGSIRQILARMNDLGAENLWQFLQEIPDSQALERQWFPCDPYIIRITQACLGRFEFLISGVEADKRMTRDEGGLRTSETTQAIPTKIILAGEVTKEGIELSLHYNAAKVRITSDESILCDPSARQITLEWDSSEVPPGRSSVISEEFEYQLRDFDLSAIARRLLTLSADQSLEATLKRVIDSFDDPVRRARLREGFKIEGLVEAGLWDQERLEKICQNLCGVGDRPIVPNVHFSATSDPQTGARTENIKYKPPSGEDITIFERTWTTNRAET